jgi:hypothetical protein
MLLHVLQRTEFCDKKEDNFSVQSIALEIFLTMVKMQGLSYPHKTMQDSIELAKQLIKECREE